MLLNNNYLAQLAAAQDAPEQTPEDARIYVPNTFLPAGLVPRACEKVWPYIAGPPVSGFLVPDSQSTSFISAGETGVTNGAAAQPQISGFGPGLWKLEWWFNFYADWALATTSVFKAFIDNGGGVGGNQPHMLFVKYGTGAAFEHTVYGTTEINVPNRLDQNQYVQGNEFRVFIYYPASGVGQTNWINWSINYKRYL